MPVCETCGEKDFQLLDGLYYCVLCHTQTQELKEEDLDTEEVYPRHLQEIRTKKVKSKKVQKDTGRPWHTHEAWTIILKRQVEALIKLGANPKLKDVVLRIWVRYLSKCGVAFTAADVEPHPESVCRDRDQCAPSVSNPVVSEMKVKRSHKKRWSGITTVKKAKEAKERKILQEALKGEEFDKGDDPLAFIREESTDNDQSNASGTDGDSNDETEKKFKEHLFKAQSQTHIHHHRHIECMSSYKTLSLCYLGLVYLHPLVVPMDLIRWAETGKFPFRYQMFRSLPDDMKFCLPDFKTFWADKVPNSRFINHQASVLCKFVGLENSFRPVPLELMCSRYIIEMNLPDGEVDRPGEFHYLTRTLLKKVPYPLRAVKGKYHKTQDKECQIMQTEYLAMGCIIVVLKLLCGLRYNTEKKISSCARKIQSMFVLNQNLFIFEDWLHYMEHSQHSGHLDPFSASIEALCSLRDTEEVFRAFSEKHKEQRSFSSRSLSSSFKTKAQTTDTQESLERPFLALLEKYKLHNEQSVWKQQVKHEDKKEEEEGGFLAMENSLIAMLEENPVTLKPEEKESGANQRLTGVTTGDMIKQSTVAYILDKTYLHKLDRRLQSLHFNETILESSQPKSNNPSRSLFSQSNNDFFSSEFTSDYNEVPPQQRPRTIGEHVEEVKEPDLDDVLKLQEQLESLPSTKNYWLTCQEEHWARAYDRTLSVCSQVIGCTKRTMNWNVWLMEMFCLLERDDNFTKLRKFHLHKHFQIEKEAT